MPALGPSSMCVFDWLEASLVRFLTGLLPNWFGAESRFPYISFKFSLRIPSKALKILHEFRNHGNNSCNANSRISSFATPKGGHFGSPLLCSLSSFHPTFKIFSCYLSSCYSCTTSCISLHSPVYLCSTLPLDLWFFYVYLSHYSHFSSLPCSLWYLF